MYGVAYAPGLRRSVATIVPGELASTDVAADKPAKLTLGGPYRLDFVATYANNKININPGSFRLRGKNGEEYRQFSVSADVAPQVSLVVGNKQSALPPMGFT